MEEAAQAWTHKFPAAAATPSRKGPRRSGAANAGDAEGDEGSPDTAMEGWLEAKKLRLSSGAVAKAGDGAGAQ